MSTSASSTPKVTAVAAATSPAALAATGLDKAFKAKGRTFIGTASDQNRFSNAQGVTVTTREFSSLTPENSMKWDAVRFEVVGMGWEG